MESATRIECIARESLNKIEQSLSSLPAKTDNAWLGSALKNVLNGVFLLVSVWLPIHLQKVDSKLQSTAEQIQEQASKTTAPFRKNVSSRLKEIDQYVEKIYSAYREKSGPSAKGLSSTSLQNALIGFALTIEKPPVAVQEEVIASLANYQAFVAGNWDDRMNKTNAGQREQIYNKTKSLLAEAMT